MLPPHPHSVVCPAWLVAGQGLAWLSRLQGWRKGATLNPGLNLAAWVPILTPLLSSCGPFSELLNLNVLL